MIFNACFADEIFDPRIQPREDRVIRFNNQPCNTVFFVLTVISVKGADRIVASVFRPLENQDPLIFKVVDYIVDCMFEDPPYIKGRIELSVQFVEIAICFQLGIEFFLIFIEFALSLY
jgi:hypothetical protein